MIFILKFLGHPLFKTIFRLEKFQQAELKLACLDLAIFGLEIERKADKLQNINNDI
jgi:hypothetical protein